MTLHDPKFLAAIIDDPTNLDLRLVYSDWMEQNDLGDGERSLYAELIRVQVELGKREYHLNHCSSCGAEVEEVTCDECGAPRNRATSADIKHAEELRHRSREILHAPALGAWNPNPGNGWVWSGNALQQAGDKIRWSYRNGFPEVISCRLEDWRYHGKGIYRETPVTDLTITDKKAEVYAYGVNPSKWYWYNVAMLYSSYCSPHEHHEHHLPDKIYKLLKRTEGSVDYRLYDTPELAQQDLSQACLRFAKEPE